MSGVNYQQNKNKAIVGLIIEIKQKKEIHKMKTKLCAKCKREKSIAEFYKHIGRNDGLQTYCKSCSREYNRHYREDNREYFIRYNKQYRDSKRGNFIYFIMNHEEVLYIGSTVSLSARIGSHMSNSNITHKLKENNWTHVKYLDIESFLSADNEVNEMLFCEGLFIEMLEPAWNRQHAKINLESDRAIELFEDMEELYHANGLITYKTNNNVRKDLYYSAENTFMYGDKAGISI